MVDFFFNVGCLSTVVVGLVFTCLIVTMCALCLLLAITAPVQSGVQAIFYLGV